MDSSELKQLLRATTAFSILSDRELDHLANRFELIQFARAGCRACRRGSGSVFHNHLAGHASLLSTDR